MLRSLLGQPGNEALRKLRLAINKIYGLPRYDPYCFKSCSKWPGSADSEFSIFTLPFGVLWMTQNLLVDYTFHFRCYLPLPLLSLMVVLCCRSRFGQKQECSRLRILFISTKVFRCLRVECVTTLQETGSRQIWAIQ
jgi:hypothetical protein